jgi:hypothetical protein
MVSRLANRSDHRSMLPYNPVILEAVPRVAMGTLDQPGYTNV